jgi:S-adenosylmethionine hydrolase
MNNIEPKFLLAPDYKTNELYILHRQYPACLIHVIQTIPVTFKIIDLYDEIESEELLKCSFLEDAKTFFKEYAIKLFDKN